VVKSDAGMGAYALRTAYTEVLLEGLEIMDRTRGREHEPRVGR